MGTIHLAATKSSSGGLPAGLLILLLFFGVLYFLMIRPQRNRQRQLMQVQSAIRPGQRVRTTADMYGTVTAVDDGDVVIEVAPGVEVRYLKRAIVDVISGTDIPGTDGDEVPAGFESTAEADGEQDGGTEHGARADAAHAGGDGLYPGGADVNGARPAADAPAASVDEPIEEPPVSVDDARVGERPAGEPAGEADAARRGNAAE